MLEFIWRGIARIVSRPAVADWIICRAQRTPYYPITSRDGSETYMDRWWLFNPYSKDDAGNAGPPRWNWLPSIRVHHIMRADDDGAMHDHPWNARTIVLRGWYREERPLTFNPATSSPDVVKSSGEWRDQWSRIAGYTGRVLFAQYHRISEVSPGGVYTLWFTWKYRGTWGFLVDGKKVPWREHLGVK
jgi:hypothetical protein